MKGNLNLSIKLANKKYNYISPKQPGTIPKGIIINKKKIYINTFKSYRYMRFCRMSKTRYYIL